MNRARTQRAVAGAAVGFVGVVVLWSIVASAFSSDRGIDFTDEGLYLLAADPPSNTTAWVTPFGWSTAPLFRLVRHDIASFRTLGVVLAVLAGGALGWVIGTSLTTDNATPTTRNLWCRSAVATVGAMGAPFFASSLLRTPGYNWVSLVGLVVGATGAILAIRLPRDRVGLRRLWRAHLAAALLAFGTCFAVPSKPTSAPLLLVAAALRISLQLGRRRTIEFAALVGIWGLAIVVFAVLAGFWPVEFWVTLWRSTRFPPLHPNQTIAGALKDVLRTPKVAWQQLSLLRTATKLLVLGATIAAIAINRRRRVHPLIRCLPLILVVTAAVGTELASPGLGGPNAPERFAWTGTANAAVLLLAAAALHLLANWRLTGRADRRHALSIAAFTIVLAMTFAFGSAMGIYHQMGLAVSLLWLAAAAVVAAIAHGPIRPIALGVVAVASILMVAGNTVDSRHHPYRNVDVAEQTTAVTVGPHGATLLVDADTASFLDRLQSSAMTAGFCHGTPLIGMAWSWSSTVPYVLGAKVPDELLLTLFGYEDAPAVLDFTIPFLHGAEWHNAWVLTTDSSTLEPQQTVELRSALDRLPGAVGRTFPTDYTLEMDIDGTQLWRPVDVARGCRTA